MLNLFPEFCNYRDMMLWWKWSLCPHPKVYPGGRVNEDALAAKIL
jgi:hypothetical protein